MIAPVVLARRILIFAAAATMLGASGCLPMLSVPGQTAAASTSSTAVGSLNTGPLRIGKVMRGDVTGVATFVSPIQAKGSVAIVPRVNATLTKLNVELGSKVRAGDTVAELDHSVLDERVLEAQAAQATAEARLAELKSGPKAEVLAAAQASYNAAQARVKMLQSARDNPEIATLDQRVKDARAALDQAQTALQPDPQAVSQADAAVKDAQTKLDQLQGDPNKSKDQNAVNAAKAEVQKATEAATKARTPRGTMSAVISAQNELLDAQQAQLIVRLSATAFDLDQAKALLDVADAELKLANAPATPEEIKAAEARVEQAFSQAELARAQVRDATITAPINGIVTEIKAMVGSNVSQVAAIMTLIPPEMQVVVDVDENQLPQLQVGQSANLSVESYPRDAFSGTVKAIAPVLDPRTRTASIQIDVPDPQGKLHPGMLTQLAIQLGQRQSTLLLPKDSILKVGSPDLKNPIQQVVYTVADGRVHRQVVGLGLSDGKNVEITQGVQEGADVVLNPRPDFLEGELIATS